MISIQKAQCVSLPCSSWISPSLRWTSAKFNCDSLSSFLWDEDKANWWMIQEDYYIFTFYMSMTCTRCKLVSTEDSLQASVKTCLNCHSYCCTLLGYLCWACARKIWVRRLRVGRYWLMVILFGSLCSISRDLTTSMPLIIFFSRIWGWNMLADRVISILQGFMNDRLNTDNTFTFWHALHWQDRLLLNSPGTLLLNRVWCRIFFTN